MEASSELKVNRGPTRRYKEPTLPLYACSNSGSEGRLDMVGGGGVGQDQVGSRGRWFWWLTTSCFARLRKSTRMEGVSSAGL